MSATTLSTVNVYEFERRAAHLSDEQEGPPYTIHGVALGAGDVTTGTSGVTKKWPADELKEAAATLQGTNLVQDHDNSASGVVGRVTKAGYKDGVGVIYQAELFDDSLADKIRDGLLEVSIRGYHTDVDDMNETENGAKIVEDIEFDNLSIVPTGASPSNTLEMGSHDELSAAELAAFTQGLEQLAEVEPSDFVQWDDGHGIVFEVQDDVAVIELMEDDDGTWRAVGEQDEVNVDDLEMWDVDEDDIGEPMGKEENASVDVQDEHLYETEQEALDKARELGLQDTHRMNLGGLTMYVPGATHVEYMDAVPMNSMHGDHEEEMMPLIREGMQFFSTVNNSQITVESVDGNLVTVAAGEESQWKEDMDNIIRKLADGEWEHSGHRDTSEMMDVMIPMPEDAQLLYPEGDDAMEVAMKMNLDGIHSHDLDGEEWYMPGEDHASFEDAMDSMDSMDSDEMVAENASVLSSGMVFFDRLNNVHYRIEEMDNGMVTIVGEGGSEWTEPREDVLMNLAEEEWIPQDPEMFPNSDMSSEEMINPPEWSEGDMVEWVVNPSMKGKVVHNPSDENIVMVEVMDGGEPTGHTLTAGYTDLRHRDAAEMMDVMVPMPDEAQLLYPDEEMAMNVADMMNLDGVHSHDLDGEEWYMPGEDHASFEDAMSGMSEEMAAPDATYSQGDWVRWDTRNSTEIGKVTGSYTAGDDIPDIRGSRGLSPEEGEVLYTLRMYDERDGTFHPIEGKPIGHYEDSVRSAEEPANVSESSVELARSNHEQYDVEEEEWVQWYPSDTTEEHGFVIDVDEESGGDDETIVTIEVWTQNSDGEWETDGEEITKTMEQVEPWGNFPREQEEFADAISGEDPRRAVKPSEENADSSELISEQVKSALKDKAEEHNEEYGDEDGKEVTYRMLKNVYERGMGAYQDSHREGMTAQQWSYARVNAFLYLVRNGNPENDQYVQDNDLLPEDHPKYNEDPPDDEEENASVVGVSTEELQTFDDYPDAAVENARMALDAREETGDPNDCGTRVGWERANQLDNGESLSAETVARMANFNRHRQNSEMDDDEGRSDCGWMMWKAWGGDEGVDWAIRKMDQMEESAAELIEYEMHEPSYDGTTEQEWNRPDLSEFAAEMNLDISEYNQLTDEQKSQIADHFFVAEGGFPATNYGQLKLPVVEPSGELSINALRAAKGGRGVSAVDGLTSDEEDEIVSMINDLVESEFDKDWSEEMGVADPDTLSAVAVLTGDDLQRTEASEQDSTLNVINMTELSDELTARLEELSEPVAVEQAEIEELREKADKYDDISEDLSELRERTEILDEVSQEKVDELAESDDPMVVESARFDALSEEAEQVKKVYASNLEEEVGVFDAEELMDKFSIEELREKHEAQIGGLEEELAPAPKGSDPSDGTSGSTQESEELSDEIAEKQDELRNKILN